MTLHILTQLIIYLCQLIKCNRKQVQESDSTKRMGNQKGHLRVLCSPQVSGDIMQTDETGISICPGNRESVPLMSEGCLIWTLRSGKDKLKRDHKHCISPV